MKSFRALGLFVVSLLTSSCAFLRPASEPMKYIAYKQAGPEQARGAIVLFPGFGDGPENFAKQGFIAALTRAAPDYDVFAADAHFTYYRKKTLLVRLDEDVIGPLRKQGYRELWLMGISMGGHGVVGYARVHPDKVRGVMMFAPYMGPKDVVEEVAKVGLCKYDAKPSAADDRDNFARRNFLWLKQQACNPNGVSLYLGVGKDDSLKQADDVLGHALDPSHVLVLPGGHSWSVWVPAVEKLAKAAFDRSKDVH